MTTDFLIGAIRASRDLHPQVKTELEEILYREDQVKPISKVRRGAYPQIQHFCGNCIAMLHGKPKTCAECGKAVRWK